MKASSLKKSVKAEMLAAVDPWVATAMTADYIVVELLLRLKHAKYPEAEIPADVPAVNPPFLPWGARKRRSRPSRLGLIGGGVGVGGVRKKEAESGRGSPMTPLCWSGGSGSGSSTCPSAATGDGFEDTSRQSSASTSTGSGSKAVPVTNEFTSSWSMKSKKRKKLLELKDAENLQIKERFALEKKIANAQATYDQRSAKNHNLKRLKLELDSDHIKILTSSKVINLSNFNDARKGKKQLSSSSYLSQEQNMSVVKHEQANTSSCRETSKIGRNEGKNCFIVPDLNMTPIMEQDYTENLQEMS